MHILLASAINFSHEKEMITIKEPLNKSLIISSSNSNVTFLLCVNQSSKEKGIDFILRLMDKMPPISDED